MKRPSATTTVLGLLCVMYLITYIDRVNIATAGPAIQKDLGLSTTQLAHIFSAFGYPYLLFQIFGGSIVALGATSLVWGAVWVWYFRDDPARHPSISREELERLPPHRPYAERPRVPWKPLAARMLPVTVVYFCYGWTLWLYLNWLPY